MTYPMLSSKRALPLTRRLLERRLLEWLALCASLVIGSWQVSAAANEAPELRVIVHPSNPLRSAEPSLVADLFLKKVTRWGNGESARPLDQRPESAVRRAFSRKVLKRTVAAVRSYWQQRIFSGRDVPPPELDSDEAVVDYVSRNPGAVGYVSPGAKLGGTRELAVQ
jgi:hypothetical protein